jgi:hypothetical protein
MRVMTEFIASRYGEGAGFCENGNDLWDIKSIGDGEYLN